MMEEAFFGALLTLLSPSHLIYLCFGVILGLVVGILPGLGGSAGLALILPFIFGMDASHALAMMIGLQSVTATSDTFPSVLMGIPGTASSQATVVDGFPLSKKGEASRALAAAFSASLLGGLFGAFILTFAIFFAEPIIMAMGFGEQLMLIALALTMIGMLTGTFALKGLAACSLGLIIGAFGAAPVTGGERLTFGTDYLIDPLKVVIVGLAMFAIPEIIDLLRRQKTISETGKLGKGWLQGISDTLRHWWIVLRCAAIGSVIGALPGLGGSVVDWIAYGHLVQTTRDREKFGTGDIRGVIAPEAANNAKEGGALIPTILFGIPGSGSMALLLGGFVLIGIEPGIALIRDTPDLVYLMIWSVAIANIFGAGTALILAPQIARLTTVRYTLIAPFMFGLIFFAAFQGTRQWGDLIALILMGVLGVYMKRFGWPRPALLIGYVLSNRVEKSIYHVTATVGWDIFTQPIVIVLVILILGSIFAAFRFRPASSSLTENGPHSARGVTPQMLFVGLITALAVYVIWDGMQWDRLTGLYPIVAGTVCLIFILPLALKMLRTRTASMVFFDGDNDVENRAEDHQRSEFYLLCLAGMLAVSALTGFVLGSAAFIYTFLRLRARSSHLVCAVYTGVFVLLLGAMSHFLVLYYPQGLLQNYVTLPWPLQ
jgi:putative tricarboxylic transport membrane protein